ncbi:MAG: peptide/nickel transport system permease protein [Thermomicrobiales bacterium]|nr:peptide/nickel transport system permease protein [Thermomicrobiales bacterium]
MLRGRLVYILGRLAQTLLVMWVVVTILFLMFRLMPGSPLAAYIDPTFTKEQEEAIKKDFGLDKPMSLQYVYYLKNLFEGDFGRSFFQKRPVFEILMDVFPNTLLLTLTAILVAYAFGAVAGAFLAWRRGTKLETAGIVLALMTRAAPEFFVGMLVLSFFSFGRGWFPASGISKPGVIYDNVFEQIASGDFWRHLILPAATLAIYLQGLPLLLMRSNMLEVLDEDFVVMSRMKGLTERRIMLAHAARNALLPLVTALTIGIGYAIGGNVIIETVFSWPGIGRLLVRAVQQHDYPLAQGAFLLIAFVIISMNFFADVLYSMLDPRVGTSRREAG